MSMTNESRTQSFLALRVVNFPETVWLAANEYGEYYAHDILNEDVIQCRHGEEGQPFEIINWGIPGQTETVQLIPVEIRTEIKYGSANN